MNQKKRIMKRKNLLTYAPQHTAAEIAAMKMAVDEFKKMPPDMRAARLHELKTGRGTTNRADEISRNTARATREFCKCITAVPVKPLCGEPVVIKKSDWGDLVNRVVKQFGIQPAEIGAL